MYKNYTTKKATFFTAFIILISLNTYSQCTENGTNFGNNTATPSYNISGDVSVTLNTNNTVTLNLASNFSTASGPDVRVYLIDSNGMSDAEVNAEVHNNSVNGISAFNNIPLGEVSANGMQSFTVAIPENTDISSYDKILFYCLQFNQFWDVGSFSSFTSSSCSVLSIEENTLSRVGVFPNPATTSIQLANIDSANTEIRIFDFSGKKVFQQLKGNTQNTIDISNFKKGFYVVSITENNKKLSKKLVIQ